MVGSSVVLDVVKTFLRYWDFFDFKMAAICHLGIWKSGNFICWLIQTAEVHHDAKVRQNWSIRCQHIMIFPFSHMAAVCHLLFLKCRNSISWQDLKSQDALLCQVSSMPVSAIFWFFKMVAVHHLGFLESALLLLTDWSRRQLYIMMPNFVKVSKFIVKISWFFLFFNMAASHHLGYLNVRILLAFGSGGLRCITVPNFLMLLKDHKTTKL